MTTGPILVAGGTGVIGRPLCEQLRAAGREVVVMGRKGPDVAADALDAPAVRRALAEVRPEVVIHQMTAIPRRLDPRHVDRDFAATSRLRTEGTRNLIAAAAAAGVRRFVTQSVAFLAEPDPGGSLAGEEEPIWSGPATPAPGLFAATRANEEQVLAADVAQKLVLRYGLFWGPGTSWDPDGGEMVALLRRRRLPVVGAGSGRMSFVHVADAAAGTIQLLDSGRSGVFQLVEDDAPEVAAVLRAAAERLGARAPLRVPGWLGRLAGGRYTAFLMLRMRGASNAAARAAGWAPERSFLRDFPDWPAG